MFKEALMNAINDMFEHLGLEIVFKPQGGKSCTLIAVIKQPENSYELGDNQIVRQVAEISIKSADATPRVGDIIEVDSKKYKIYEEPLLDASTLIWKFFAALIEE